MSHDHREGDALMTGPVVAGFERTPGPRLRVRCLVRHRRAFVLDRS